MSALKFYCENKVHKEINDLFILWCLELSLRVLYEGVDFIIF